MNNKDLQPLSRRAQTRKSGHDQLTRQASGEGWKGKRKVKLGGTQFI
jgi:hypothetical protein